MSLDVYLISREFVEEKCICECCQNEHVHRYRPTLFQANITHNLAQMASEVGIYDCVWRPDENGFLNAEQLIEPLTKAYDLINADYSRFAKLNPENGWGTCEYLLTFVFEYLEACKEFPTANIEVCR